MCAFKLLPVVSLRMCAFKSLLRWQLARLALAAHVCVENTQKYIYGFLSLSLRMCAFKMLPLETCANVCACDALTAHVCVQIVFWLLPDALAAHVCVLGKLYGGSGAPLNLPRKTIWGFGGAPESP